MKQTFYSYQVINFTLPMNALDFPLALDSAAVLDLELRQLTLLFIVTAKVRLPIVEVAKAPLVLADDKLMQSVFYKRECHFY